MIGMVLGLPPATPDVGVAMVGVTVGVTLQLEGGLVSINGGSPIIAIKSLDIPWGSGSVSGMLMTLFSSAEVAVTVG